MERREREGERGREREREGENIVYLNTSLQWGGREYIIVRVRNGFPHSGILYCNLLGYM